jgi:dienelactone hydrolase
MAEGTATPQTIDVPAGDVLLRGDLQQPPHPAGLVLFVHGSGSGRLSPRNQYVAQALNRARLSTLLIDLLTEQEGRIDEQTLAYRFDIPLLTNRVRQVTVWLRSAPAVAGLAIGYFGASTGAAAALIAAAALPQDVAAVVSRGGRPDLAEARLPQVKAPTLLIVGGADDVVLALNRTALALLTCEKALEVVPGATHLFEEPGALERVAALAGAWFLRHLQRPERGV